MKHTIGLLRHDRPCRVVNALAEWNEHLSADTLHLKYCKMASSPFVFYRGSAHLFWADFAGSWRVNRFGNAKTRTWLQGDAHAENLGAFHDHEGDLLYGLNDFDESVVGDYQYDLWRFAISLVLVARANKEFSGKMANVINALCESYLDTMASLAKKKRVTEISFGVGNTSGRVREFLERTAKEESREKMLKKWTSKDGGKRRFDLDLKDKLEKASKWERADILAAMDDYRETLPDGKKLGSEYFEVQHIARRLSAGTGSLGTPRYYALIRGKGGSWKDDRILDVKRQSRPSALGYLSAEEQIEYRRTYDHDAQRHAVAYEALAKHPDHLMGWMRLHDGFYSVRERSPFKETFDTTRLQDEASFIEMARFWAKVLATDHARAVRKLEVDGKPYSIAREVTKLTRKDSARRDFLALVRDQAFEYANQVRDDHEAFVDAVELLPRDCKGIE